MPDEDRIEVMASAERRVTPSGAVWTATLVEEDADGRAAFDRCAERQRALVGALEAAFGDGGVAVTPVVRLGPRHTRSGAISGFQATASVIAHCPLDRAPDVARAAVDASADRLDGPRLEYAHADAARSAALVDAVPNAREKAERLAEAAGTRLGRVLALREGDAHDGWAQAEFEATAISRQAGVTPELRPDELTVKARVWLALELMT